MRYFDILFSECHQVLNYRFVVVVIDILCRMINVLNLTAQTVRIEMLFGDVIVVGGQLEAIRVHLATFKDHKKWHNYF